MKLIDEFDEYMKTVEASEGPAVSVFVARRCGYDDSEVVGVFSEEWIALGARGLPHGDHVPYFIVEEFRLNGGLIREVCSVQDSDSD